jgi:hypothetical protein
VAKAVGLCGMCELRKRGGVRLTSSSASTTAPTTASTTAPAPMLSSNSWAPRTGPGRDICPYCRHPYVVAGSTMPRVGSQPCAACQLGKTLARVFGNGQILAEREWLPLEEFAQLVGRSVYSFRIASGWRDRLQLHRMEGRWMVPSSAINALVASWMGSQAQAQARPTREMFSGRLSLFLTTLAAFRSTHQDCGRVDSGTVDGGMEGDRVWFSCSCGATIHRSLVTTLQEG